MDKIRNECEEIWKDIRGHEGKYQVSNLGRIKRLRFVSEKIMTKKSGKVPYKAVYKERIREPYVTGTGYRQISFYGGDTRKVSRMVGEAFLKDYSERLIVDHIDGNKLNDSLTNLRMATRTQNGANCFKQNENNTSSRFKGVCFDKKRNKWIAAVRSKGIYLGWARFDSEVEAAKYYDKIALQAFGSFAKTNSMLKLYS